MHLDLQIPIKPADIFEKDFMTLNSESLESLLKQFIYSISEFSCITANPSRRHNWVEKDPDPASRGLKHLIILLIASALSLTTSNHFSMCESEISTPGAF